MKLSLPGVVSRCSQGKKQNQICYMQVIRDSIKGLVQDCSN